MFTVHAVDSDESCRNMQRIVNRSNAFIYCGLMDISAVLRWVEYIFGSAK